MHDVLKLLGFSFLFIRFSYWIGLSLALRESKWKHVLFSQFCEGLLLFFIFTQVVGKTTILPMQQGSIWEVIGFSFVCIGVLGSFAAKKQLGDAWVYAAAHRVKPHQQLITQGLYSLVRHPIYTCFALSYIGIELLVGSWLWISAIGFFIGFYFQARKEEKDLIAHFGKAYEQYRLRTKMLIPYLL